MSNHYNIRLVIMDIHIYTDIQLSLKQTISI